MMDIGSFNIGFLHECFSLKEDAGQLVWKVRPDHHFASGAVAKMVNSQKAGTVAGHFQPERKRVLVHIGGRHIGLHRLVFAISDEIDLKDVPPLLDHVDGDTQNNRRANLRSATVRQNAYNMALSAINTSGYKGVVFDHRYSAWVAQININGVYTHLGSFNTRDEAAACYIGAAKVLHKEFYREIPKPVDAAA